jgi:excinuclease ABC subunit B
MFKLVTELTPKGDQAKAIKLLTQGIKKGLKHQVLLGVTGSGKTFTIANVIANVQRPALVIAPNKTLAAQLYSELKRFFPYNAVEYFVSYYDYYQPEAYIPQTDTYIQKDASINEHIDKLRHSATRSLLERDDVIIVASVSCIYGLGSPEAYHGMILYVEKGDELSIEKAMRKLVEMHYVRNEWDFTRGRFRVRGDILDKYPVYEEEKAIRITFFDDEVEAIQEIDPITGRVRKELNRVTIFPATHYVTTQDTRERAIRAIKEELRERIKYFEERGKLVEAQRIKERTL